MNSRHSIVRLECGCFALLIGRQANPQWVLTCPPTNAESARGRRVWLLNPFSVWPRQNPQVLLGFGLGGSVADDSQADFKCAETNQKRSAEQC